MRDKQIEEMVQHLCNTPNCIFRQCEGKCRKNCIAYKYAVRAISAGYRKASDVIEEVFLALDKRTEDEGLVFIKKSDIVNAIKKKKVEIAREIFEEIEKLTYSKCFSVRADRDVTGLIIDGEKFAELKKKYESEGEG